MRTKVAIALVLLLFAVVFVSGCSKGSDSYYSLKEGRTWEYKMLTRSRMSGSSETQKIVLTNLPQRELRDKKVTPQKVDIGGATIFMFIAEDSNGIYLYASQSPGTPEPQIKPNPEYILKNPIKVGTTWEEKTETNHLQEKIPFTLTSTIESIDETVTVPAGTFKGCVKVKGSGNAQKKLGILGDAKINIEHYNWFAPGIGMIKSIVKESSNHMMVGSVELALELESFKK